MERAATTASSLEAEQDNGSINRTQSMATLNEPNLQGTSSGSGPSTPNNGEMEITAIIDGEAKIVTEASIRRHLKLEDSDGVSNLPTTGIFKQLALMGSLPHTNIADEAASTGVDVRHGGAATTVTSLDAGQGSGNINKTSSMPHDLPLPRVHTLGSDEGRMQHNVLIDLVTKLSKRVVAVETNLRKTKKIYGATYTKLIKKVKKLEKTIKSSQARRRARIMVSDNEDFTTANVPVTTAGAEISTASPEVKTAGDSIDDIAAENLVYIKRSAAKTKDKGKGIMEESESAMTKTKRKQEQERLGLEIAVRLQEEFDEEERQRIAKVHEEASSFNVEEWENIKARVESDEEIAARLLAEEQQELTIEERSKLFVELMDKKKYFAAKRAEEKRNKPPSQAQQRTYMSNYIKHMGSHTLKQLRGYSFNELKNLFEATMRRTNTFVPMEPEIRRKVPELVVDSSQAAVTHFTEAGDELSQEELQQLRIIVPEEGMNIEALQTKYPIIDWEIYTEDLRMYWKIIRVGNHTERLYHTCGVHHVSIKDGVDIYMLVKREYPLSRGVLTQILVAKLLVEQDNEMSKELLKNIFMQMSKFVLGICIYSDAWGLDELEKTLEKIKPYNSCLLALDDILNLIHRRTVHEKIDKEGNTIHKLPNQIETNELFDHLRPCELVIRENVYSAIGNRDHTQAVIALILYCLQNRQPFNLAYFIIRRIYFFRDRRDKVLPYVMILTHLFKNLKENMTQGSFDEHYKLVPRKMYSLKAKQPKKPLPKRTRNVEKSKRTQLSTSSLIMENFLAPNFPLGHIVELLRSILTCPRSKGRQEKISPPKDIETPIESPIPISPSSSVGSSSSFRSTTPPPDYPFDKSILDNSLWIIPQPLGSEPVPEKLNESDAC
ncbi:hypothetical protein Tco_1173715 [Tanacetum coccineum]